MTPKLHFATRYVFLACSLFSSLPALAQEAAPQGGGEQGSIVGVVVDSENGETLPGANVVVEGTATGTTTDFDGRYELAVDPGTYNLVFSYIGYNNATVQNVEVAAGEPTRIEMALTSEAIGLDEVVVEARAVRNSEAALLSQRQKAAAVSDAISAEAIGRSGSSTASDALTKVTGASVVGGKYVYVRGLGDRYMNTQLNGTTLPSADPDRNAVPLDLFPSGLLDNIVTTKTFTPDKPGSFTGGSVDINTKDFPETLSLSVSGSLSYNTQVGWNDDYLTYRNGSIGLFQFGKSEFDVPGPLQGRNAEIPTITEANRNDEAAQRLDLLSRSFSPVFSPTTASAPVSQSYSLSFGNQLPLLGRPLGFLGSLSYSRDVSNYDDGATGRYVLTGSVDRVDQLSSEFRLNDTQGTEEALFGALAKVTYQVHPKHELGLNYIQNRSAESVARYQIGKYSNYGGGENQFYETRVLNFVERSLNTVQANGKHAFTSQNVRVEWNASFASTQQDEPDLRYFSNNFSDYDDGRVYDIRLSLYPAPTRYFRNLEEGAWTSNLSVNVPFQQWSGLASQLKVGGTFETKDRTFRERHFVLQPDVQGNLYQGNPETFFTEQVGLLTNQSGNFNRFGLYVDDVTLPENSYDGDSEIAAAFAMVDVPLTQTLRVIGGARYEYTSITVASLSERFEQGELGGGDLLPSLNLVYQLQDNMNLRAAYGRTLARPTFRELAPYASFSFVGDYIFQGNPALERTLTNNYDLRWEWFMRPGEILATSLFFKDFSNPIERVILNENGEIQYQNVAEAAVYGAEFEARRRLPFNLQAGGNLTLTYSRVQISEDELREIRSVNPDADDTRKLQGQSPFVVNVDLAYDNPSTGSTVSLYYNIFGRRLAEVSLGGTPDVFEEPRGDLDLLLSQRLPFGFTVKASAKNLLNDDYRLTQAYKGRDYVVRSYERGREFSLGFSYSID